ncbi:hypothetical protein FACS1894110_14850 [Spirochaetia bacterium]|nr:hypothetical protein FACS1894110_14850 [Spirochaetia bacterium]
MAAEKAKKGVSLTTLILIGTVGGIVFGLAKRYSDGGNSRKENTPSEVLMNRESIEHTFAVC